MIHDLLSKPGKLKNRVLARKLNTSRVFERQLRRKVKIEKSENLKKKLREAEE